MITFALPKGPHLRRNAAAAARRRHRGAGRPRKIAQADLSATNQPDVRVLVVRASDVPTYVQYGGADLGVAGKDTLLEHGGEGLYQPLDLHIAKCRMSVAVRADFDYAGAVKQGSRLRVATKYVADRARFLRHQGRARRPDQALRLDGAGAAGRPGRCDRRSGVHRQHAARRTTWSRSSRSWTSARGWSSTRRRSSSSASRSAASSMRSRRRWGHVAMSEPTP